MEVLKIEKMLRCATSMILENIHYLTELDSVTGDGDHGVSMSKIAQKIDEYNDNLDDLEKLSEMLNDLSWDLMNINGGSAGPLWGAFFEGMAKGAEQPYESEDEQMKHIFLEGYNNFSKISGAKPGDKTMMDAIYPATKVIVIEEGPFNVVAMKMAAAAEEGAEDTMNMIAKFGRAKSLKEKSIGHKDPGAVSFSLFYKGIAQGINQ